MNPRTEPSATVAILDELDREGAERSVRATAVTSRPPPPPIEGGALREGERVYVLLDSGERVHHGVFERFDGLLGWIRMDKPGGLVQPIPAPLERIHPDDGIQIAALGVRHPGDVREIERLRVLVAELESCIRERADEHADEVARLRTERDEQRARADLLGEERDGARAEVARLRLELKAALDCIDRSLDGDDDPYGPALVQIPEEPEDEDEPACGACDGTRVVEEVPHQGTSICDPGDVREVPCPECSAEEVPC